MSRVSRLEADIEGKARQLAHRDAALEIVDPRNCRVTATVGVLRNHFSEAAGGVELHPRHRRQRISRQHHAALADQCETGTGARGKRLIEALERLRRHRNFSDACEGAGAVEAPLADGKNQSSGQPYAQDFADMDVRIRRQLRFQMSAVGRVEGGRNRKEHRRYHRVHVLIQDPDRTDVGQRGNELLEPLAQLGCVQLDGLVGAAAGDLLDAVEGDADRLEHPQRLFRGDVARALDALVGEREGRVVVGPGRVAEQQQWQRHAGDQHQLETSKRGVPALSHAESSHQPPERSVGSNTSYRRLRKDGRPAEGPSSNIGGTRRKRCDIRLEGVEAEASILFLRPPFQSITIGRACDLS